MRVQFIIHEASIGGKQWVLAPASIHLSSLIQGADVTLECAYNEPVLQALLMLYGIPATKLMAVLSGLVSSGPAKITGAAACITA